MEIIGNNDLFRAVFDSAPNGIAVMEPIYDDRGRVEDFTILLFNNYTRNWINNVEYQGKRYSQVFPMVKPTGILEKFIRVAETGESVNFERWYDGEGMKYWFRFTAVKQGEMLVVTTEDITEGKRAELAINDALDTAEKQRRLYHSITNNTPDLVYVFTTDYKFAYANKALLNMWGKTAETAIGVGLRENGYEEWHALMHEREIDDVVANKKNVRGTVSFPHAELGVRIYDYILVPVVNEKGEVEAVAGTTRDITETKLAAEKLQLSETRFRNMIDQNPAATLVLRGNDLIIDQMNKRMVEFIGRGDQIIGMPLIAVMPELDDQDIWAEALKVYRDGVSYDQNEVLVRHNRTGTPQDYYYNVSYRPLIEDGVIAGMIQVVIDVTSQVLDKRRIEESEHRYRLLSETLEQKVNERTQELLRSNSDLQQFAHVASHDLKEPVRKVKTFTSRLEEHLKDQLDETAKRYIERIHVATDRMFNMIDGVLGYSEIDAGLQLPESVDLNVTLHDIETDLEVMLQRVNGKIQYQNLPQLEGAQVLLYQLFYNLINNSIKFAKAGVPPVINVSAEVKKERNVEVAHITLSDNGIGFEPQYAAQIFDSFTRLNSKDAYEGTGLGLSLCKKIVERHGGTISATGNPNEGAQFLIKLPLKQYGIEI